MEDINQLSLIKLINIKYEGIKYICQIKIIEEELININIFSDNKLRYKGNILLDKIQIQIKTFLDYTINEIFEEINKLNNNNFSIIKEDNKYKLKIKFIILRRKKYLYINLNDKNNNNNELYENIIKEKDNIIYELNKKIKLLEKQLKNKTNNLSNNNLDNNFDISLKNPIHTLNCHKNRIFCLSILNDGRLISSSRDNSIIIYNKTTYQPDLIIKEHKDTIRCIIQLSSGIIATCSEDKTIKLFNIKENKYNILQTLNDHTDKVNKIIELKNNKYLISCSDDKSILFYFEDNLKYKIYHKIAIKAPCYNIKQIKENEICYSERNNYDFNNNKIYFYDINERKIKASISNISKNDLSPFIMISKDLLFISGYNKISIININEYKLIREIEIPNSGWINRVYMINKNILLTRDEKAITRKWKIEQDNLVLISKKEKDNDWINTLLNIGNGYFESCSEDKFSEMGIKETHIVLTELSKDCDYYKDIKGKISNSIKNYYEANGEYPKSKLEFYLYGRQIGHGAFGKIYLALHIASGKLVAIKAFSKKNLMNIRANQKIINEINILSHLHHPFINQILDSFEIDNHIFIVMEYVCGNLLDFIRKRGKLSESISKLIFKQIIEGLRYIHKNKIVHRDIKLNNILIDLTNTVKICDFGISKKLSDGEIMYEQCGTPAYIAPEIFKNEGYEGYLCDIWSAGVTLYYMLSGSQPFRANSIEELKKIVIQGKFDEIKDVSKEANDLINEMFKVDPIKRINIDKILNHPWLKNVDLENRKNLNLFTESEKILLLSKFDVDYFISQKEELIENFSLENLEINNNEFYLQNDSTKSIILTPYNSYIYEEIDKVIEDLQILNDACKFESRVQKEKIQYELNNNNIYDNGVVKEKDIINKDEEIKKNEEKIMNDKIKEIGSTIVNSDNDSFEDSEQLIIKNEIIQQIEKDIGYDRQFIINCLKKNEINYATATYNLLKREKH